MKRLKINIPDDRGKLYDVIRYPAGEIQVRLTTDGLNGCKDASEYVISANPIPDLIELAQLKDALDGVQDWHYRVLDLMYLPYARADRRFVPGDSFGLAVFARFLNSLEFDVVYTFDVHSEVAMKEVNNLINLDPIIHYDQIAPIIKYLGKQGLVLVVPDKGAEKRYDLLRFDLPIFVGEKLRDQKTGQLSGFRISPSVEHFKKALIVDDICDGGGTFVGLGEAITEYNPDMEISLYVSHGIFSKGTQLSGIKKVFISDYSFRGKYDKEFTEVI